MKCPYCGFETEDRHCSKCFAMIPDDKPEEKSKDKSTDKTTNHREVKRNGT